MFYTVYSLSSMLCMFLRIDHGVFTCQIIANGVSKVEENVIVEKHNELRQLVACGQVANQPRATDLRKMKYSSILAQKAQEIAVTCEYGHKNVTGTKWQAVGQNLYLQMHTADRNGSSWNDAIQSWFDEYKFYEFGARFNKKTGHYTQVIWAKTEYVGCGYTYFAGPEIKFKYHKFYVCNYGPAGNIIGQNPYTPDYSRSSGCIDLL